MKVVRVITKRNNTSVIFMALVMILSVALISASCRKDNVDEIVLDDADFEPIDWTAATHSKDVDPNFDEVFDNTQVKRLDIVITSERWQTMLDDMTEKYGVFGSQINPIGGPGGPGGPGGGGGLIESDDPVFVPAEIFYKGKEWYRVGVRFKGNSSLQNAWTRGILKLSLKLDFDEFEDDYPQIENQRFYGFKKFSLKNNSEDKSCLREKVSADIFANAGLAVSHTAFYQVYIDHGDGPEYFGLYTLVEEVDNTVIKTQFSGNDGNLYKPEGYGATFAYGAFDEASFEKKTNEDESDWSDIQALFTALHDGSRTSNPEGWRANLETVFDTDVFLKYLAINTVIQNWDTYGLGAHNFYLYNNPENGKLCWIPWDNNEALQDGRMFDALLLDFSNLQSNNWPLIEYLYADDVYKAKYDQYVKETIEGPFEVSAIQTIYANYSSMVEPYVTSERSGYSFLNSGSDFQQAVSELNQHVVNRKNAANDYLY
jgi:spore coat protein H